MVNLDENPATLNKIALALFKLGRYDDALKIFEKAIERNPSNDLLHANFGEILFALEDFEKASEKVNKALEINKENTLALLLRGKIEIEHKKYQNAVESFYEAIRFSPGNPELLLWNIYAKYLNLEFKSNIHNENVGEKIYLIQRKREYQEGITVIIRKLERIYELSRGEDNELKFCILYFLGYFYYKSKDIFAAKNKLKECISIKSKKERIKDFFGLRSKSPIEERACELLKNIWNTEIKPCWWIWWLFSPFYFWTKRILFFISLSFIFIFSFIHPFITQLYSIDIIWPIYITPIIILTFILLSPTIRSIRTQGVEVELHSPSLPEAALSPSEMEIVLRGLET